MSACVCGFTIFLNRCDGEYKAISYKQKLIHDPTQVTPLVQKWPVLIGIGLGMIIGTINYSIINVSLPTLVAQLQTNFTMIQWVLLSFALTATTLLLTVARASDMVGKKKVYLWGLGLFTLASLLCGFSPSVGWLIGFRVLQGVGSVMTQALGLAIITEVIAPEERGMAIGLMGGAISVGLIAGPGVGGLLIGLAGWRWIFWINVPLGLAALWAVMRYVPNTPPVQTGQRFDAVGALILAATLFCFSLAMTLGQERGFGDGMILGLLTGSVIGLLVFLAVETVVDQPMMNLGLYKNILFSFNLAMGLLVFITLGGFFVMPFYLELVKGYSPAQVGLLMMVVPALMGLVSVYVGKLSDRLGFRWIIFLGLVILVPGFWAVSTLKVETGVLEYIWRMALVGIGFGIFQTPNNIAIMGAAPREHLGVASGLLALSRNLGQSTGLPFFGAVFSAFALAKSGLSGKTGITTASPEALMRGINGAFRLAALIVLIPVVLAAWSWWIDRRQREQADETLSQSG
ncbi:MAG: MFS transporter [Pseudomonadota bacterium]